MEHFTTSPERSETSAEFTLSEAGDYVKIDPEASFDETENVTFYNRHGDEQSVDGVILANITTDNGERVQLVRATSGHTGVLREREGRLVAIGSVEKKGGVTVRDADDRSIITIREANVRYGEKPDGQILINQSLGSTTQMGIHVDIPGQGAARKGNYADDRKIEEHNRKWRKIKKFLAGIALTYGTLHSGGLVDEALDGFNDAHSTVYEAEHHYNLGDQLDGVYNYNAKPIEEANDAIDVVAHTMDNLDTHNYDAIRSRAQAFLAAHPGEILPQNTIEGFADTLNAAQSLEAIKTSLKPLEDFYGFTFTIPKTSEGTHLSVEMARNTVHQVQRALARLPRSLVRDVAHLQKVEIVAKEDTSHYKDTAVQAYYDAYANSITMFASTPVSEALFARLAQIPGSQEGGHLDDNFLHELGHGLAEHQTRLDIVNRDVLRTDVRPGDDPSFDTIHTAIDILKGGILMRPDTISTYSRENSDENAAENIAGVIDTALDAGLTHPDEIRKYTSQSNKTLLRTLIGFQRVMPGLADYLVSTDPRLMDK